jgi:hypothetical protein
MKLLEVAPDFLRSQVGTLMTILQYLQSKTEPGTKIPIQNITNLMNNAGYSFNADALEGLKNKFPALDELIGNFDKNFITLGKSEESEIENEPDDNSSDIESQDDSNIQPPDMGVEPPSPAEPEVDIADGRNPERATVDKMAARASRF